MSIVSISAHINEIIKLNLKAIKTNKKEIINQLKLVNDYSKNSYDLVVDAQGLIKSALVTRLLSKNRVGFSKESIREKFASFF